MGTYRSWWARGTNPKAGPALVAVVWTQGCPDELGNPPSSGFCRNGLFWLVSLMLFVLQVGSNHWLWDLSRCSANRSHW